MEHLEVGFARQESLPLGVTYTEEGISIANQNGDRPGVSLQVALDGTEVLNRVLSAVAKMV